jgi:CBS domain containing-hemolysin-like protein
VLKSAYRSGDGDRRLSELARCIEFVPEAASVDDALETMLRRREHMLMVVDEYGGLEGIVTLEDAVETLLGREIVDEDDDVVDLQQMARERAHPGARRRPKNAGGE